MRIELTYEDCPPPPGAVPRAMEAMLDALGAEGLALREQREAREATSGHHGSRGSVPMQVRYVFGGEFSREAT